ncbi:hypothetical protein BGZ88_001525, partial [Linnemannia elongata]
ADMDKKNPAGFLQSDQILLLPTKQPPPYSSSSSSSNEDQNQSSDPESAKKKNDSSARGGSSTMNLSQAANVAYGDPSVTPVISVPPGPNAGMTSGTDALPSSDTIPVTQGGFSGPSGDFSSSGATISGGGGGGGGGGNGIAEIAIATATAVATVRAIPVQISAAPSTTFAVSWATVATPWVNAVVLVVNVLANAVLNVVLVVAMVAIVADVAIVQSFVVYEQGV